MTSGSIGKGKGRQKIKMEKMENESNLQVTFSKRRNGVFKKAHELSILTGAELAAIVFSPGGKVYSFGHPTTEAVIDRFLTGSSPPLTLTRQLVQAQRSAKVIEINKNLACVKDMIEYERNRGEAVDKELAESQNHHWGGSNVDGQNLWQLQQSVVALKNTKAELDREIKARVSAQQNYRAPGQVYNYHGGERVGSGGYGVGGGGSVFPGSTDLSSYGNGGDWLFGSERNLYDSAGTFVNGSSSFVSGDLSNTYEASSSVVGLGNSGGVWSFNDGLVPIDGGVGGPFVGGSSSFVGGGSGDGLLNTEGASSSGVGICGGGSNTTVPEWNGSMPPNGFGGGGGV